MQLTQGLSVCLSCPVLSCDVLVHLCWCCVCAFNWRCPGGVPICPTLFFQEAVAGASILGAMTAGTGMTMPQLPQAVMAAQAPGVITGRCIQKRFVTSLLFCQYWGWGWESKIDFYSTIVYLRSRIGYLSNKN